MRKMIDCFPGWGGSNLGATFCPKLYEYIMFSFFSPRISIVLWMCPPGLSDMISPESFRT